MKGFGPHKFWMVAFIIAVVLIFSSAPLLGFLQDKAAKHLAELQDMHAKTQQAVKQLEDDIAATRQLSGQIGVEDVERSLAYVDRLQAADMLEKQAATARLAHFTYTVSPEQKFAVKDPVIGAQELAISNVSVKAEAPLDTDAYGFIERVRSGMPGRLRLQSLTLDRMGTDSTPLAADNLRMTADFEWLSNGVARKMAEGR